MLSRRRLLFDDIDVPVLRRYVARHRASLCDAVGTAAVQRLEAEIGDLDGAQAQWKARTRRERSLRHAEALGWIDAHQAAFYGRRPLRWLGRQAIWAANAMARGIATGAAAARDWIRGNRWRRYVAAAWHFASSGPYRARVSKRYVYQRLLSWHSRQFLEPEELRSLRLALRDGRAARDISDFGVHLAIKAPVSMVQYWVLPGLFLVGVIDAVTLALGVALGESVCRTVYTGSRVVQCISRGTNAPWVALAVGVIPVIGIAAFPLQLVRSAGADKRGLARFIVCDTFATIGRAVPVWGGRDSLVEHWFNRVGRSLVTGGIRGPLRSRPLASVAVRDDLPRLQRRGSEADVTNADTLRDAH
jgi:hypothetical protein